MDLQRASDIISRARSIADLPNTDYISHYDEIHSLNEAWKDVYSALKDSDDDYYVTETTLTVTAAMAVSGATNEYLVPLPADVAQVRYLDYRGTAGDWRPVKKFPMSSKDNSSGEPRYRLKGAYLWIVGEDVASLRLGYYPPPALVTVPQGPYYYGASYTPLLFRGLTSPCWAAYNKTMVYVAAGLVLTAESMTMNTLATPVALFTEAALPSNLFYYKGTLFWVRAGNLYSKDTALTAAFITPTALVATGDIVAFYIINNTIYYSTGAAIRSVAIAGGETSLISTTTNTSLCRIGGVVYYVDAAGALKSLAPAATLVASGIAKVTCDTTYLYTLGTDYVVNRLTLTAGAVTATEQLAIDVLDMGHATWDLSNVPTYGQIAQVGPDVWMLPIITRERSLLLSLDTTINHNFDYPNNLVPEIMAHRVAVDFRGKGGKDTAALEGRLAELWERFRSSIKRDEYEVAIIKNAYARSW
jgi:hypothetical protein